MLRCSRRLTGGPAPVLRSALVHRQGASPFLLRLLYSRLRSFVKATQKAGEPGMRTGEGETPPAFSGVCLIAASRAGQYEYGAVGADGQYCQHRGTGHRASVVPIP